MYLDMYPSRQTPLYLCCVFARDATPHVAIGGRRQTAAGHGQDAGSEAFAGAGCRRRNAGVVSQRCQRGGCRRRNAGVGSPRCQGGASAGRPPSAPGPRTHDARMLSYVLREIAAPSLVGLPLREIVVPYCLASLLCGTAAPSWMARFLQHLDRVVPKPPPCERGREGHTQEDERIYVKLGVTHHEMW